MKISVSYLNGIFKCNDEQKKEDKKIKILINDEKYPEILRNIKEPPKQLQYIGNIELLIKPGIAIIGSRNCTRYGKEMAIKFSKELSQYGLNIISGMAMGVDSYAHEGSLEVKGNTIAVLPSGLKNIYPMENKKLFEKIIDSNGLIISEYEDDFSATSESFLERNRIVSGLSIGILVIEGAYRSGTSVTAKLTIENNKKVFCVPSSLKNPKGYTPNHLIRKGGILVTCAEDIIEEYKELNIMKRQEIETYSHFEEGNFHIKPEYQEIYETIEDEPTDINEILKKTRMSLEQVNYQLMMLELDGYIISLPGRNYKRK